MTPDDTTESENELVARMISEGRPADKNKVLAHLERWLTATIRQELPKDLLSDEEDVKHAIFVTFLRKATTIRHNPGMKCDDIKPWFRMVISREITDFLKKRVHWRKTKSGKTIKTVIDSKEVEAAHAKSNDCSENKWLIEEIWRFAERELTESQRHVLRLHLFEDPRLTFEEIAACMGRKLGTITTWYYSALSKLRSQFDG